MLPTRTRADHAVLIYLGQTINAYKVVKSENVYLREMHLNANSKEKEYPYLINQITEVDFNISNKCEDVEDILTIGKPNDSRLILEGCQCHCLHHPRMRLRHQGVDGIEEVLFWTLP